MVRTHFPAASLIESPGNLGYGAAANRVFFSHTLAHDAEFLILANSDIVFAPGSVGRWSTICEHSEAAVTGPKLLNPDRSLQRSCFPLPGSVRWTFDNDAVCVLLRFFPPLRGRLLRLWKHDAAREVPWVKGALLAIWGAPAPQKSALQWPGSCSQVPCASPAASTPGSIPRFCCSHGDPESGDPPGMEMRCRLPFSRPRTPFSRHRTEARRVSRKILIVSPFPPRRDAHHGGYRSTAHAVAELAEGNLVRILCLRADGEPPTEPALTRLCDSVEEIRRPGATIGFERISLMASSLAASRVRLRRAIASPASHFVVIRPILGPVVGVSPVAYSDALPPTVLFAGNFMHPPLRERSPGTILRIAGESPTREIRALAAPDIEITGRVSDMQPLLAAALGAEGLRLRDGHEFVRAETDSDFVDGITALLQDPARRTALGAQAQAWVSR